jgi:hypothetical protein
MMAILLIGATAATFNWITEGNREKETELAWRGNQYVRAIRLYAKKYGHPPHSITDLTDYHSGQPRVIRQAYTDPMSKDDGSWHLIYVLPNGQLVGSVMHRSLSLGGIGAIPANPNPLGGQPGSTNSSPLIGSASSTATQTPPANGQTPAAGGDASQNQDQQQPTFGSGQVFGGSLVGVSSKSKKPSIRIYQGGTNYSEWEFIWDPTSPTGTIQGTNPPPKTPPATGSTGQPSSNQ